MVTPCVRTCEVEDDEPLEVSVTVQLGLAGSPSKVFDAPPRKVNVRSAVGTTLTPLNVQPAVKANVSSTVTGLPSSSRAPPWTTALETVNPAGR